MRSCSPVGSRASATGVAERIYLRVAFRGPPERLFAAVASAQTHLRRLREHEGGLAFDVSTQDLISLRRALRGQGRLRVLGHGGWALAGRALARSPGRLLLPLLGAVAYMAMASLIWSVQVIGPPSVPRAAILRAAAERGLDRGGVRLFLHPAALGEQIRQAVPGLLFCSVRIDGGRAYIWTAPALRPPAPAPAASAGPLVAATEGYVTRVVALRGVPVVRRGDTVLRGEALIAPGARGAMGSVYARVWRLYVYRLPNFGGTYVRTGRRTQRWFVAIGPVTILAPQGLGSPYRRARAVRSEWRIPGTPVEVGKVTFAELRRLPVRYSPGYARLVGRLRAQARMRRELPGARVLGVREALGRQGGSFLVDVWVEAEINIARTSSGERADY